VAASLRHHFPDRRGPLPHADRRGDRRERHRRSAKDRTCASRCRRIRNWVFKGTGKTGAAAVEDHRER
jgi:hypothetical protein